MSFQFALEIMIFSEILREQKKYAFADQVLRSGCSIGANVKEAIHKMKVVLKEAEETEYWLELSDSSKSYPKPGKLLKEIESILKVINKIISSSKGGKK